MRVCSIIALLQHTISISEVFKNMSFFLDVFFFSSDYKAKTKVNASKKGWQEQCLGKSEVARKLLEDCLVFLCLIMKTV